MQDIGLIHGTGFSIDSWIYVSGRQSAKIISIFGLNQLYHVYVIESSENTFEVIVKAPVNAGKYSKN
jgi:hypothetical protein